MFGLSKEIEAFSVHALLMKIAVLIAAKLDQNKIIPIRRVIHER